jgi:hypothetical protein
MIQFLFIRPLKPKPMQVRFSHQVHVSRPKYLFFIFSLFYFLWYAFDFFFLCLHNVDCSYICCYVEMCVNLMYYCSVVARRSVEREKRRAWIRCRTGCHRVRTMSCLTPPLLAHNSCPSSLKDVSMFVT